MQQERKRGTFHMRCLRSRVWLDKIKNEVILQRIGCGSLLNYLETSRLCWFGHAHSLQNVITKNILYGELSVGQNLLRLRDVVKRNLWKLKTPVFE